MTAAATTKSQYESGLLTPHHYPTRRPDSPLA
jgi:hypothetical protein